MDKLLAQEYFVAAAQAGSFAGAARHLDVSVPSIHKLTSSLKAQPGVRLFERSHRGLTLTGSGETYFESSRPLLEELAALDRAISRSADNPGGILVIGAPSQLAHYLLLPSLPRFRMLYPDVQIAFRVVQRPSDGDVTPVDVFVLHGWPAAGPAVTCQPPPRLWPCLVGPAAPAVVNQGVRPCPPSNG